MMKNSYEDKQTQKARLLKVLKEGKKVTQIDLPYYPVRFCPMPV